MSNHILQTLKDEFTQINKKTIPDFSPGYTIAVQIKIEDSGRVRLQSFEGLVIAIRRRNAYCSFTVRKISYGIGVERVFHLHSPLIDSIQVKRLGKVRRAKLYYMRNRTGRKARIPEKLLAKHSVQASKDKPSSISPVE